MRKLTRAFAPIVFVLSLLLSGCALPMPCLLYTSGALSQGRTDCGKLAVGYKADLCVIDTDTPQFTPMTDAACNVVYAAPVSYTHLRHADRVRAAADQAGGRSDLQQVP